LGTNLELAFNLQNKFEINKFETNDINLILTKYGIEMARWSIIK